MESNRSLVIASQDTAQTEMLGERIGKKLRGGELIELVSDLGGGKTTFTRGLVRGTGSEDRVASPTFTVSRVYDAPSYSVHHFDLYRLAESGMVGLEFEELLGDPSVVVIAEWAGVLDDMLPEMRMQVRIAKTGDDTRAITINCPDILEYLIEDLV